MTAYAYDIKKLAKRKAELGLVDRDLARLAGVVPSTVKNVLTGKTAKASTIKRIADALGVDLASITTEAA
jgi:transcriptional regulator with XRE-family HTH domain